MWYLVLFLLHTYLCFYFLFLPSISFLSPRSHFPIPSLYCTEELNHAQDEFNTQAGLSDDQLQKLQAEAAEEDKHRNELLPRGAKAPEDDSQGKTPQEKRQWKIRAIQSYQSIPVFEIRRYWAKSPTLLLLLMHVVRVIVLPHLYTDCIQDVSHFDPREDHAKV